MFRSRIGGRFLYLLAFSLAYLLVSAGGVLHAQNAQGSIVGHVTDPSGQAIQGAKVTVRNSGTNVTNTYRR